MKTASGVGYQCVTTNDLVMSAIDGVPASRIINCSLRRRMESTASTPVGPKLAHPQAYVRPMPTTVAPSAKAAVLRAPEHNVKTG